MNKSFNTELIYRMYVFKRNRYTGNVDDMVSWCVCVLNVAPKSQFPHGIKTLKWTFLVNFIKSYKDHKNR